LSGVSTAKLQGPFEASYAATAELVVQRAVEPQYIPAAPWLAVSISAGNERWRLVVGADDPHGEDLLDGIYSTPNERAFIVVAAGAAYAVDAFDSQARLWLGLKPRSVREVVPLEARGLIVLVGDLAIGAYMKSSEPYKILDARWVTDPIAQGDLRVVAVGEHVLRVSAWCAPVRHHVLCEVSLDDGRFRRVG